MPRIATARVAAEPSSADQRDRYQRILVAAARLGAESDYERVQMHDVARAAGVAIATLYRYFPSKAHLFTAVMRWRVEQSSPASRSIRASDPADRAEAIADLLIGMTRQMVLRPRLSLAMIQANNQTQAQAAAAGEQTVNDVAFQQLVLDTAGIGSPTPEDDRRVRLVVHCWYGVLTSVLNGRIPMSEAEDDVRVACRLLIDAEILLPGDQGAGPPADQRLRDVDVTGIPTLRA